MSRFKTIAAGLAASLLLAGCADEPKEPEFPNALLNRVPADTPYVFASGEPVDEAVSKAWREQFRPYKEIWKAQLEQVEADLAEDKPALAEQFGAVMDEIMALSDSTEMEEIGLSREDRVVLYGHGLMPVLRFTVSDPEAFRAFVKRLGAKSGVGMGSTTFEGREVSRLAVDPVVVLGGIHDGVFSVGLSTLDGEQAMLGHLFASGEAGDSLAGSGAISGLIDKYGFERQWAGFVDVPRAVSLVVGDGEAPGLLDRFGAAPEALTPACRGELVALAGMMPRLVVGSDGMTASETKGRSIFEFEPGIAQAMAGWTVPVPGLGVETDARYAFGMSMDGAKAAQTVKGWMKAAAERQFECAFLAAVPWQASANQVNVAPLYMAGNPKGFMITLDELEIRDIESRDFRVSASAVAVFDNAQTLSGMARMMSPKLQSLDLPTDGTPVQVPADATPGLDQPLWLASTETVLGLSIGEEAEQRVEQVMGAEAAEPPPFLFFDFDAGWFFNSLADWMPRIAEQAEQAQQAAEAAEGPAAEGEGGKGGDGTEAGQSGGEGEAEQPGMTPEEIAELKKAEEMMRAYAEIFDRVTYQVRFTENGVELAQRTTLKE